MESYYRANSVGDASDVLQNNNNAMVIAGGQQLMLDIRHGKIEPDILIDISEIEELTTIRQTSDEIQIGACVTYSDLKENSLIRSELPYFVDAVEDIAGPQVRHNGSVGGALCDADPVYDSPVVLLTLDATLNAVASGRSRTIPLSEFFAGYCRTDLEPDEILTTITVPKVGDRTAGTYRSMTPREGDATIIGVAVRLTFDTEGICTEVRIALTNADVVPKRAVNTESVIEGTSVTDAVIGEAVETLKTELNLGTSHQTSKAYRETVLARMTDRAVRDVRRKILEENK